MTKDEQRQQFEAWSGNAPVEFDSIDKDQVSFWCWKAWQKAVEHEREACAKVCDTVLEESQNIAASVCAGRIRMRGNK